MFGLSVFQTKDLPPLFSLLGMVGTKSVKMGGKDTTLPHFPSIPPHVYPKKKTNKKKKIIL